MKRLRTFLAAVRGGDSLTTRQLQIEHDRNSVTSKPCHRGYGFACLCVRERHTHARTHRDRVDTEREREIVVFFGVGSVFFFGSIGELFFSPAICMRRREMGGIVKYLRRWLAPNSMMMLSSPALLTRRLSLAVEESSPSSTAAASPQMPPFDHTPQPYTGPRADEILAKRKKFLNPAMFLYYKKHASPSPRPPRFLSLFA